MKKLTSRASAALLIGLLTAGSISTASADTGTDANYALPKTDAPNFYIDVGAGFLSSIKMRDVFTGLDNMAGGAVAFGWRINQNNKIQLEAGLYSASDSDTIYGHKLDADCRIIPVLFSYSYVILSTLDGRAEFRVTPTIGYYSAKLEISTDEPVSSGLNNRGSGTGSAFAFGVGAGFTWHFTPRSYMDIGYRILRMSSANINNLRVYMDNIPGGADHVYFYKKADTVLNLTAAIGLKF
ncbi:MAG: porin family protein [Opitutaceae bacterium]|jgi:opacity protein-like surface antigen|nr:porin family protein [Opitutaceae bacterium]